MAEKKQKRVSYVESSFDQATNLPTLDIGAEEDFLRQVRSPDGERTFPGESLRRIEEAGLSQHGFLWADTPESSVFIRKKQWHDDGWNYAIEVDPSTATQEDVDKAIYKGEIENRKIRDVLGKIITRKLEWLNDHEQFTKSAAALRAMFAFEETPTAIQSYYDVGTTGKPLEEGKDYKLLNNIVTEIAELAFGKDFAKKDPNLTARIKSEILSRNSDTLRQDARSRAGTKTFDVRTGEQTTSFNENDFQTALVEGTLKISEGVRLFYDDGSGGDLFINSDGTFSTAAEELLLNLYAPTQVSDGAFTRYFLTREKGPGDDIIREKFNGIVEFANIASISTSVSLKGTGSATLTFEDPGNIMFISRDDIELALSEVGNPDGSKDKINEAENSDLIFYRGRYYPQTVLDDVISKEYTDIDTTEVDQLIERKKIAKKNIDPVEPISWRVEEGNTLTFLAEKFNTTIDDIVDLNPFLLGNVDLITGEVLLIPNTSIQEVEEQRPTDTTETSDDKQDKKNPDQKEENTEDKPGTLSIEEKQKARDKLRKLTMNRHIIEPVDHVWIWMTSPSKSIFTLPSEQQVVEAPDSVKALDLQADEVYVQLLEVNREIEVLKEALGDTAEASPTEAATSSITSGLPSSVASAVPSVGVTAEEQQTNQRKRELKKLELDAEALTVKLNTIEEERSQLVLAKKEGRVSTDQATANRTDLLEDIAKDSDLYSIIRETQGISEQQFQVFEGVITDVSESYSNGKYTLTATCKDIFYFLEISRIMDRPGLRGTTGPKFELNNPIVTTDEESKEKRGAWKSGMLVKYDEMLFPDSEKNANAGKEQEETADGQIKREQVAVISASEKREQVGIFVTDKPFAKTDAANVISLLVLGIPYNVNLFVQNAILDGRIQLEEKRKRQERKPKDTSKSKSETKQSTSDNRDISTREGNLNVSKNGYFQVIKRMIGVQNDLLGDFKPFIPLTRDTLVAGQKEQEENLVNEIKEIEKLAKQVLTSPPAKDSTTATATVDLTLIGGGVEKANGSGFSDTLADVYVGANSDQTKIGRIEFITQQEWQSIKRKTRGLTRTERKQPTVPEAGSQGRGVLAELYSKRKQQEALKRVPDIVESFLKDVSFEEQQELGILLRDRIKRREDVVRHRDENYLTISSEYTFNNNIESFNYMIGSGNWSLWQSNYETPLNTCKRVAEVVYFEFFADENGNIRFEPPRYNRILQEHLPRLFGQQGVIGDELRKRFKTNNFQDYINLLRGEEGASGEAAKGIEKLEEDVQAAEVALRKEKVLQQQLKDLRGRVSQTAFLVETLEKDIKILEAALEEYSKVTFGEDAEQFLDNRNDYINSIDVITSGRKERLISIIDRYNELKKKKEDNDPTYNVNDFLFLAAETKVLIDESIATYEVEKRATEQTLSNLQEEEARSQEEVKKNIKVLEDNFFKARKSLDERKNEINKKSLDLDEEYPKLSDLTDDAKIHRIPDAIIETSRFREGKPRFTRLDVSGEPNLVDLTPVHELYYWAGGVDYDLWRTYGFIKHSVKLPYLHRGDACRPYCEALLGRQWGQIFTGTITVRGDSKYKVHDVAYVESRDMYYRISEVSHNFTYGSSYKTTLTLDYGRRPEFIIPDPWDILGRTSLDATKNDSQMNETITKKSIQEGKKLEEQQYEKDKETAKGIQKSGSVDTVTPAAKVENSERITERRQQPQASTEAKSNKAEQEKKKSIEGLEKEYRQAKIDLNVNIRSLSQTQLERNEKQQETNAKEEEIAKDQAAGEPGGVITVKSAQLAELKKELAELDKDISELDKENDRLKAKVKSTSLALKEARK